MPRALPENLGDRNPSMMTVEEQDQYRAHLYGLLEHYETGARIARRGLNGLRIMKNERIAGHIALLNLFDQNCPCHICKWFAERGIRYDGANTIGNFNIGYVNEGDKVKPVPKGERIID
jgi:hypothetical protein